jgi:hypothetical protein
MINQKNATSINDEFGEKCRKALEKSYGSAIPIPKCSVPNRSVLSASENLEITHKFKTNIVKIVILVMIDVAAIVYALGIASDLFASPILSAFFFVSYATAHEIAYVAASAGDLLLLSFIVIVAWKTRKVKL